MEAMTDITIRRSTESDRRALERLAELDTRRLGSEDYLVAETGSGVVAAVPLAGGAAIADPFRPTARIVHLLRLRAAEIREAERVEGVSLLRRAGRLRPRAAAQA